MLVNTIFSQVKAVLEAVSILLSDPLSSFVCLIAVDSRVAVNCIENTMCTSMIKSNVNGQDYLKKIINLPFCLPEVKGLCCSSGALLRFWEAPELSFREALTFFCRPYSEIRSRATFLENTTLQPCFKYGTRLTGVSEMYPL